MKLIKRNISAKDGSGTVLLCPETAEDLWHTYNLLQPPTDIVKTSTTRKVISTSTTGSTTSTKMKMNISIRVSSVDFDPDTLQLRLSGINVSENEFVRMGAHHTLTLELNRNFTLEKECWDMIYLQRIDEACHPERQAEIAAVVMQASGLAHVVIVAGPITVTKAKIDITIPRKRTGSNDHSKSLTKFYEAIYQAILRHIDFNKIKCVICASPGFVKDEFYKYLLEQSVKRDDRIFIENKSKFLLCKASSGHLQALQEIFADIQVMSQIDDTMFAKEVLVLRKFMRMIDTNPEKAYYGFGHVFAADQELAVETLMVTDDLFRSSDVVKRKKYVQLVESVKDHGGTVYIFSTLHVSGQQLKQVSGVAAILRFALHLDNVEQEANNAHSEDDAHIEYDGDNHDVSEDDNSLKNEGTESARLRQDLQDMGL